MPAIAHVPVPAAALANAVWLIFAVVAIVLGLTVVVWSGRRSFPGYPLVVYVLWCLNRFWAALWYRLQRVGPCTVPPSGPVILTANHGSTADPLMLYATCPRRIMGFMIAREYAHLPVLRHIFSGVRCIPVKRDSRDTAATRTAIRRLRAGEMLGIFIEGRISRPGETEPAKDGVALLALQTGATVVPAYISGLVYRDGVAASFFARHRARVRYGQPVDLSEFTSRDRETLKRATSKIHTAIQNLTPQPKIERGMGN
ncbi:MAG: 1-acyl-sn-glycerol-3-phosphate acyltransferase [Phycisphaerae bacterium]|nr:1-acyl-sn-glycerol-3-phosphate acyltransferase [Phycisphaerae bacterium]